MKRYGAYLMRALLNDALACTCLYSILGTDVRLLCCWRCRDVVLASDCLVGRSVRSDQEEEKEEARQDR